MSKGEVDKTRQGYKSLKKDGEFRFYSRKDITGEQSNLISSGCYEERGL